MKKGFWLNKEKKYLIYGAGGGGLKLIKVLKEKGCLKGFIDKRAAALGDVRGEKVWDLNTLKELLPEAENIVIILTTKNVFEHTDIAHELAAMGFDQCIYKPLPILKGYSDNELEKISMAHDVFLVDIDFPKKQVLAKVNLNYKMQYKDSLIISQNAENEVLTWMPLELIFNYKKADVYEDLSMAAFFPLVSLYRLFLGNVNRKERDVLDDFYRYASEWAYSNQIEITEELKASWVESRWEAFAHMQEISDYDFDFFLRNAPLVEAGDKSKFYMVQSGRNRVVFLVAKGYRHIPVRLQVEDYEHWINKEIFSLIKDYMEKEHVIKTTAPVPHPYFKDIVAENVDYNQLVLFPISEYLIYNAFSQAKRSVNRYNLTDREILKQAREHDFILCDLEDEGACSRYLSACGFNVSRVEREGNKFTILLDKLFYQNVKETDGQSFQNYNVLILDHSFQNKKLIEKSRIKSIICIDAKKEILNFLEEFGYTCVNTLSKIYCRDRSKMVQVYIREKLAKSIIIFGCGGVGIKAMQKFIGEGNEVIAFADNSSDKWGNYCKGKKIIQPNKILCENFDYIAIGVFKAAEIIKRQLCEMGVKEEQIIVPIEPDRIYPLKEDIPKEKLEKLPACEYLSRNTAEYQKLNVHIEDEKFLDNLNNLKKALLRNNIPREKVCIVSGAVLQVLGLRKSKEFDDIDIIMTSDLRNIYGTGLVIVSDVVEMHKKDEYDIIDDDIIENMDYHFVFSDLKFMHPQILFEYLKEKPGEEFTLLKGAKLWTL